MFEPLLRGFTRFPDEGTLVGRMLAAYGELEIDLMHTVSHATDLDTAIKTLFRERGEWNRINNAEKLGQAYYSRHGLAPDFARAIDAMRYCRKIRNLYSHCQWYDDFSGQLAFVNLEEIARSKAPVRELGAANVYHVNKTFLQDQEAYFQFTSHLLGWTNNEGRHRAGKSALPQQAKPAQWPQPPLYIP